MQQEKQKIQTARADKAIVFFDGLCNFCDASVQFILKRDHKDLFLFAPLQSQIAKEMLPGLNINPSHPDSIILSYKGKIYDTSAAVFKICILLGWPWRFFAVFLIVPPFIRNAAYKFFAKMRYKWFGKKEVCMLPTPEQAAKFIS